MKLFLDSANLTEIRDAVSWGAIDGVTTIHEFGYDLAGRLVQAKDNGVVVRTYGYDDNGNRLSLTTPSGTTAGTYDAQDRLLSYGDFTFAYTTAGELSTRTNLATSTSTGYSYDVYGNLTQVTLPNGDVVEYLADPENRRIQKKKNGLVVKAWLYRDELRPIAELDAMGNVVSRFVYALDRNVPDYMVKGGTKYRLITDQVGSVRMVVDAATGAVAQQITYDEFGVVLADTSPGFQPFGFAGGLYDADTGLVRFGARDYDAGIGRWTNKDPIRFGGGDTNLYAYANSDAVNSVDSLGLEAKECKPDHCDYGKFGNCVKACSLIWKLEQGGVKPKPEADADKSFCQCTKDCAETLNCGKEWKQTAPPSNGKPKPLCGAKP